MFCFYNTLFTQYTEKTQTLCEHFYEMTHCYCYLLQTSVTDVLQAMGAVPAGFRESTLVRLGQQSEANFSFPFHLLNHIMCTLGSELD